MGNPLQRKEVETIFRKAVHLLYGQDEVLTPLDELKPLEDHFRTVRKRGVLLYEDLERIEDPKIWSFSRNWRWPAKKQIQEKLEDLRFDTDEIDTWPNIQSRQWDEADRWECEKELIRRLYYDVFKNLDLISIVLRFLDPQHYGIYSPPVAFYLSVPRGENYLLEFRNYQKALRNQTRIYGLPGVGYTDLFFWCLAMTKRTERLKSTSDGIIDLWHSRTEGKFRLDIQREIYQNHFYRKTDRERAEIYRDLGDYLLAMRCAGVHLEECIFDRCEKEGIKRYVSGKGIPLRDLKIKLSERLQWDKVFYINVSNAIRERNNAMHAKKFRVFNSHDVDNMLSLAENIKNNW